MARILIVDDDQGMREFMEIMLEKEGHDVTSAENATKALNLCNRKDFDFLLLSNHQI